MDGPDFGILKGAPTQAPQTQVVQLPNYSLQNEQGLLAGVNSLNDSRKTSADIQNTHQQMAMQQQLQPGILAQQAATLASTQAGTQGQGLLNQQNIIKTQDMQRTQSYQKAADAGYNAEIASSGDKEKALNVYSANLSPEAREAFDDTRATHKEAIAQGNATSVSRAAGIVASAQKEIQSGANPQKLLPYIDAQLDRVDPGHPRLKTVEDLHNYSVVTLGTLLDPKVQQQLRVEQMKLAPEIQKVKNLQAQAQATYDNAQDKNSPEAQQALKDAKDYENEAEGEMYGKGIGGQIEHSALEGAKGVIKKVSGAVSNLISSPAPTPGSTTPTQQSKPAVKNLTFNPATGKLE